jgi:predicted RNase H-like HicB family nuclease
MVTVVEYNLPVIVERDADGYYAECPFLQGCYSQGETYEEVLEKLRDAIVLHIQDRRENGEALSIPDLVSVATLKVSA